MFGKWKETAFALWYKRALYVCWRGRKVSESAFVKYVVENEHGTDASERTASSWLRMSIGKAGSMDTKVITLKREIPLLNVEKREQTVLPVCADFDADEVFFIVVVVVGRLFVNVNLKNRL